MLTTNTKELRFFLVKVLVVLMPFHAIFFAFISIKPFALWRDILMILLVIMIFVRKAKVNLSFEECCIFFAICVCTIHAVVFHDEHMPVKLWGNSLRIYLIPFLAYYIGKYINMDIGVYDKIKRTYVYISVIVSIWGIFQMFILGPDFLISIGFGFSSAVFSNGFQRNVGVFASANFMGVYIAIALMILLFGDIHIKYKKIFILFLGISLILSFSASAILGLVCAVFYRTYKTYDPKVHRKISFEILNDIFCVICSILLFLLIDYFILNGLIGGYLFAKLSEIILTLHGVPNISSAQVHMDDLRSSFFKIRENPMGFGFSVSSMILLGRVDPKQIIHQVESSIYTIFFDFGIVIGSIYIACFIIPLVSALKDRKKANSDISDIIAIQLLILYIFLPLVSSIELRFYFFLFLGIEERLKNEKNKKNIQKAFT